MSATTNRNSPPLHRLTSALTHVVVGGQVDPRCQIHLLRREDEHDTAYAGVDAVEVELMGEPPVNRGRAGEEDK